MIGFTGPLRLDFGDWGKAGRIAQLIDPIVWTNIEFVVTVPAGTMSDGASVPRLLWWFLPPWGDKATFAAILHDFLQTEFFEGRGRPGAASWRECDAQFHAALISVGVPTLRAGLCWAGVRLYSTLFEWGWMKYGAPAG